MSINASSDLLMKMVKLAISVVIDPYPFQLHLAKRADFFIFH